MSNDLRTLDLFTEANPVSDIQTIETPETEPAAYLATLQQRSSEVIDLEQTTEAQKGRRSWLPAAVAAAVVVIVGLAIVQFTSDDPSPPVTVPPIDELPGALDGYWVDGNVEFSFLREGGGVCTDGTGECEYTLLIDGVMEDQGRYDITLIDGDWLVFMTSNGTANCNADVDIISHVTLADNGNMNYDVREDGCGPRLELNALTLTPAEPPNSEAVDVSAVVGSWATGDMTLVFAEDGYSIIQAGSVVDRGTYVVESSPDSIVFTSVSASGGCEEGDTGRMFLTAQNDSLILTPNQDDCLVRSIVVLDGELVLAATEDVSPIGLSSDLPVIGIWGTDQSNVAFDGAFFSVMESGSVTAAGRYVAEARPHRIILDGGPDCSGTYLVGRAFGSSLLIEPEDGVACPALSGLEFDPLTQMGVPAAIAWDGDSPAGRYVTGVFEPAFEFTLPEPWSGFMSEEQDFHIAVARDTAPGSSIVLLQVENRGSVDETVVSWTSLQGISAAAPEEVTVGGASGLLIEFETTEPVTAFFLPGLGGFQIPADASNLTLYILDVGGTTVTVFTAVADSDDVGEVEAELESILDSIVWRGLGN